MSFWRTTKRFLDSHRDCAFDLLRIYLGVGLFVKGVLFASDPALVASLLRTGGGFEATPTMIAHFVAGAHLVGGAFLAVGLFTRLAALVQVPVLVGAVLFVHSSEGLFTRAQNLEFALLVLFLLVLTVIHGAGRWSLDHYVGDLREQTEFDTAIEPESRTTRA